MLVRAREPPASGESGIIWVAILLRTLEGGEGVVCVGGDSAPKLEQNRNISHEAGQMKKQGGLTYSKILR
jgi:hypothetical protein